MDTVGIIYAIITVMAWGSWLVPSQNVKFPNEQAKTFFVALCTTVVTVIIVLARGELGQLSSAGSWIPVVGGLIWSVSAYCAFVACNHIGIAKAFGIWAPLNIIVSFIWSLTLFGQFRDSSLLIGLLALQSVALVTVGILMILFSGGDETDKTGKSTTLGLLGAVGAGILWGTYYIPSAYLSRTIEGASEVSAWASVLPLAVGMLIGTSVMVAITRKAPKLESRLDYFRALSSGGLWALGNFGMLLTVNAIGPGPGYTIASLCVVVNALWGVFYFKDPAPKTRAALLTIIGVLIATLAGLVLGNLELLDSMYEITRVGQ
ncbi:GRP family sugar transporter [Novipirellula artificiosorum]|uniref:Glucose uptake protein GlcU n=1 Tax=Novipirellula artificiosorum TaxID=2528016 RepID=A0A5C6DU33_9BACT|nr:GRP family sugar transporter [Novipirellula artificiosorum]TWU38289.1 Glucose uptake protein GlcU [Novipirellula artificiosorum]